MAPAEAVIDGGAVQYAFVVHDGIHFEPRRVQIGRTTDNWVEITDGLAEGDIVVTSANFLIDSESRLKAAISGMGGADDSADDSADESVLNHMHGKP
jgi:Cu(I)/Ag(I) efflux system membrane fusion protein